MTVLMLGLTRKRGAVRGWNRFLPPPRNRRAHLTNWPGAAQILQLIIYNQERLIFQKAWSANFSNLSARLHNFHPFFGFFEFFSECFVEDWKGMSLFVKGIQGISSSCPILMKQSKVISRQVSCFSPILDMSPFVEHVGSVQLLSKNKTARDILTQEVFVFLVRFVHTCISIFCHLCLLLLCLWSHVIHVAQPKMTDWHLEGLAFCTFLSTTSAVHRFSSKF